MTNGTQPAPRAFNGVWVHGIFAGTLLPQARPAWRDIFLSQTTLARKKSRALVILRWNSVPERTRATVGRRRDEGALLRLRTGAERAPQSDSSRVTWCPGGGAPGLLQGSGGTRTSRGGGGWDWAGRSLLTDSSPRDPSEGPGLLARHVPLKGRGGPR